MRWFHSENNCIFRAIRAISDFGVVDKTPSRRIYIRPNASDVHLFPVNSGNSARSLEIVQSISKIRHISSIFKSIA